MLYHDGIISEENKDLIDQIRMNLKIEDLPVTVFMLPYNSDVLTAQLVAHPDGGYFILISSNVNEKLTQDERKALIAHEMGHIAYTSKIHLYDLDRTGLDICADIFASKYAGIDAVLSLLEKLYTLDQDDREVPDYKIRKAALEAIKKIW